MSQTLTLSDDLYDKLSRGAAERGLTIESLLTSISDLVIPANNPTTYSRERSRRVEHLLARCRSGSVTEQDRAELDQLIDVDYQEAVARADRRIAAKQSQPAKPPKRLRK